MKKIYFYLFALSLVAVLNACNDDEFLQENPPFLSPISFYQTESDAVAGLNPVYWSLKGFYYSGWDIMYYGYNVPALNVLMSEVGIAPESDWSVPDRFQFTASSEKFIHEVWQSGYYGIFKANVCIEGIERCEIPNETLKNRLLAEGKFIRALHYYTLVRFYENIPLIKSTSDDLYSTNVGTYDAVYDFIFEDLQFAIGNLPDAYTGADQGRVTRGAALGFLAKAYLDYGDYANAAKYSDMIIKEGKYKLYPINELMSNWDENHKNEKGWERMFEIQNTTEYGQEGSNGIMSGYTGPMYKNPSAGSGFDWGTMQATHNFYDSYSPDDKRRSIVLIDHYYSYLDKDTVWYNDGNTYLINPLSAKYVEWDATAAVMNQRNYVLLRYADVLLVNSEAKIMQGIFTDESFAGINAVRERAGLQPLVPANETIESMKDKIIDERQWELSFENTEYFDLVRMNKLAERNARQTTLDDQGNEVQLIDYVTEMYNRLPIPDKEINLNPNLKQNPGY
ncbi:MAG: RagB/SusD family nutrient uptake outer membrane protein [Prolixibacteraceae bacterium]